MSVYIYIYVKASKPQVKSFTRVKSFSIGGLGVVPRIVLHPAHATRLTHDRHPQHFPRIDKRPPYQVFVNVRVYTLIYFYIQYIRCSIHALLGVVGYIMLFDRVPLYPETNITFDEKQLHINTRISIFFYYYYIL